MLSKRRINIPAVIGSSCLRPSAPILSSRFLSFCTSLKLSISILLHLLQDLNSLSSSAARSSFWAFCVDQLFGKAGARRTAQMIPWPHTHCSLEAGVS